MFSGNFGLFVVQRKHEIPFPNSLNLSICIFKEKTFPCFDKHSIFWALINRKGLFFSYFFFEILINITWSKKSFDFFDPPLENFHCHFYVRFLTLKSYVFTEECHVNVKNVQNISNTQTRRQALSFASASGRKDCRDEDQDPVGSVDFWSDGSETFFIGLWSYL